MREENGLRRCIISLATADKRYPKGLARLQASAREHGFDGEWILWQPGRFPAGCPSHGDVPFAFKPYCFREARAQGMDLVLWLDSSCVVTGPLDDLFHQMKERGYVLYGNRGYRVGEWASDAALERLSMSRDEAMRLPEVNGAAVGLNLASEIGSEFLERWYEEARHGTSFRGVAGAYGRGDAWAIKWNRAGRASTDPRVRGHRYDQSVAGILAHRLGMELTAEGVAASPREAAAAGARAVIVIDREFTRTAFDRFVLGRFGGALRRRFASLRGLPLADSGRRSR